MDKEILKNKKQNKSVDQKNKNLNNKLWHTKHIEDIVSELGTDIVKGLSDEEAKKRLSDFGYNEIKEKGKKKPFMIFLSQFNDFMIWILIAAAFISGIIVREIADAIVILIILVINAILGFVQEYKAEKALEALRELAAPVALVVREGKEIKINSKLIVRGDIIKLSTGDLVPADSRIINEVNLLTDESMLTGESTPVKKHATTMNNSSTSPAEMKNIVFSGTTIVKGRCNAIVVETGETTEIGKIANLIQEQEELTPLQKELKSVGKKIGIICIAVSIIVFISGILKGNTVIEMLLVAVALAVAAIPEGLPAIVTISLALGVQRMAKNNAIVRKLSSVETLGGVTVICTDKTGTLTENKMTVRKIFAGGKEITGYENMLNSFKKDKPPLINEKEIPKSLERIYKEFDNNMALMILLENAVLCNDAYYIDEKGHKLFGDPTETALIEMGRIFNLTKPYYELKMPRKIEEPFDSIRKMMTTVHELNPDSFTFKLDYIKERTIFSRQESDFKKGYIIFTKGAPEEILKRCTFILKDGNVQDLTKNDIAEIEVQNKLMANKALRNLAFAFKFAEELPDVKNIIHEEHNLIFCGLVGMIDPPRPEVSDAIEKCRRANIKVIMVTGDHYLTAKAIGEELKILKPQDKIIEGIELDKMTPEELEKEIENISIFARVSPVNKVGIVDALKKNHHIVAMTGDGINDAPSLKKADIGIAMGITGTDVSKEASKMILTDDNFATIIKAIKEGRVIFDNLKKFILFLLSCNISEVLLMFISITFGSFIFKLLKIPTNDLYIPLIPVQILWMNLITDGFPALALGIDLPGKNIMDRKAVKNKENILGKSNLVMILWQGFILTSGALTVYFLGPKLFDTHSIIHDREIFQTCVFTTLVLTQLLHAYNFRFSNTGIFKKGLFANKFLNLSFLFSMLLQLGIIYIPFMQKVFKTQGLNLTQWVVVISCSLISVLLIGLINRLTSRKKQQNF
ncbi:MAG: cation-translocating P-type ATPase [Cyanobacteria bacterium]|nr:cation-translocating P-type ATPase [Cyanobacteriota bacterium]